MLEGKIYKLLAGVYYIDTLDREKIQAKAKGSFRNDKISPKVGDNVVVEGSTGSYRIKSVLPRRNELLRPSVSNIDNLFIVLSVHKPEPDLLLAEKLIFAARANNIQPHIIVNKCDLDQAGADKLADQMRQSGANVLEISVKNNIGLDALRSLLKNSTSCFVGQSAVGKSSISSYFLPGLKLSTGGLSKKTDRGKHTTRCCELFCFDDDCYIVDTPGFSLFDDILIDPDEFVSCFDEGYLSISEQCRFRGCSHTSEPDCAVKNAVSKGELSQVRYERYCKLYKQINENWRKRYD